ncbi:MAG: DUF4293 domain-containing protein [Alistipes sp.]|nr:DUF4293 domain-containing protein [Alistipes sp.]
MIQRIQTLYLMAVTLLMVVTLIFPLVFIGVDGHQVTLSAFTISDGEGILSYATSWLGAVLCLTTALPFVTIFLYKNRQLQIRLCGVQCALLLGAVVLVGAFTYSVCNNIFADFDITWSNLAYRFPIIMPLISLVLTLLAMRAILRDELLVRSLDRIR